MPGRGTGDTQAWVAAVVRAGLDDAPEVTRQVVEAIRADHPDLPAEATANAWIAIAVDGWLAAMDTWPEVTDHDRLLEVFGRLQGAGVLVLAGCADHWSARDALQRREPTPRGILWFTPPDVWHALDEGMLEVNLWHGTTANAAPGDDLLDEVLAAFAAAGLEAHFDEGRIEVAASWQRRFPGL